MIDTKNKQFVWFSFSELLPAFTSARTVGNLWSNCLGVNILSPVPLYFVSLITWFLAPDTVEEQSS